MRETTDTRRQFETIPEGEHILKIAEVPLKKRTKSGKNFIYEFTFLYSHDGKPRRWKAFFMPWDLGVILAALGFKQISDHTYEWDREECNGRTIKAVVCHVPDKDDLTKVWPKIESAKELTMDEPTVEEELAF